MSMNEVHDMNIWKSNKTQHVAEWSADNNRKTTDEELLKLLEILSFIKVYKTHTWNITMKLIIWHMLVRNKTTYKICYDKNIYTKMAL